MCERNWLAPSSFGATRDRVEPDASSCSRVARLRHLERPLADSPIPAAAKARCLAPPREADRGMFLMSSWQFFGKVLSSSAVSRLLLPCSNWSRQNSLFLCIFITVRPKNNSDLILWA